MYLLSQYIYIIIDRCSQNQANRVQADVTKNQVGSLLSQIAPQFLKQEFAESQNRIVTQVAPQHFNPAPTSPQHFNPVPNNPQNLIEAIASELKINVPNIMCQVYYVRYMLPIPGIRATVTMSMITKYNILLYLVVLQATRRRDRRMA